MLLEKQVKGRMISNFYHNRILEIIYREPSISRERIAQKTGLGASIIYRHVKELKNRRIIGESGQRESEGGRRTELLSINPKGGYLIGASIRKDKLICVLSDLSGKILQSMSEELETVDKVRSIVSQLSKGINKIIKNGGFSLSQIYGVGVGTPGVLDVDRKIGIANIHVNDWRNIPIKEMIQTEINLPVFLENNNNLTALAENRFGQGKGISSFLALDISFGIGMGVFLDGHPYIGTQGRAGEVGHIQLDPDGPFCTCGNRGCLESLVSIPSLVRQAKEAISQGVVSEIVQLANNNIDNIEIEMIYEAMHKHDKLAINLMQKAADNIGLVIGNIVNLLNPEIIILGGEINKAGQEFLDMLNQSTEKNKFLPDTHFKTVYSKLSYPQSVAMGAIALVQKKIFIDNEINILEI